MGSDNEINSPDKSFTSVDDLTKLNRLRGIQKRQVTNISKHVDKFNPESDDVTTLHTFISRLRNCHATYNDIIHQIVSIAPDDRMEALQDSFDSFEEQYYSLKTKIIKLLKDMDPHASSILTLPKVDDDVDKSLLDRTVIENKISNEGDANGNALAGDNHASGISQPHHVGSVGDSAQAGVNSVTGILQHSQSNDNNAQAGILPPIISNHNIQSITDNHTQTGYHPGNAIVSMSSLDLPENRTQNSHVLPNTQLQPVSPSGTIIQNNPMNIGAYSTHSRFAYDNTIPVGMQSAYSNLYPNYGQTRDSLPQLIHNMKVDSRQFNPPNTVSSFPLGNQFDIHNHAQSTQPAQQFIKPPIQPHPYMQPVPHTHNPAYHNPTPFETRVIDIRPPALHLPEFSGNYMQWVTFRDTFIAHIHSRSDLSDIVKFTYLMDKLKGEALDTIGSITLSSEGYQQAWKDLNERYDNTCLIVDRHIDALLNLPYCSKESATDLRKLLNECNSHVSSLIACGKPVDGLSELFLINIVKKRFDSISLREWERTTNMYQLPQWNRLLDFLKKRCFTLEQIEQSKKNQSQTVNTNPNSRNTSNSNTSKPTGAKVFVGVPNQNMCFVCNKGNHRVYQCIKFLHLTPQERQNVIKNEEACFNCLRKGHDIKDCSLNSFCRKCQGKHNTLLHIQFNANNSSNDSNNHPNSTTSGNILTNCAEPSNSSTEISLSAQSNHLQPTTTKRVLLSTAIIYIADHKGFYHRCRILLDSGSQLNIITEKLASKLGIRRETADTSIFCLNNNQTKVDHKIQTKIKSRYTDYHDTLQFLVVPSITNSLPSRDISISNWSIPSNLILADPEFHLSQEIDALLGAEVFFKILKHGKIQIQNNLPYMQDSEFGWLLNGCYDEERQNFCLNRDSHHPDDKPKQLMQSFGEVDHYPTKSFLTLEEKVCEDHFRTIHSRDETRRFITFPFKKRINQLYKSKAHTQKQDPSILKIKTLIQN